MADWYLEDEVKSGTFKLALLKTAVQRCVFSFI
jgi:hypothetical protein